MQPGMRLVNEVHSNKKVFLEYVGSRYAGILVNKNKQKFKVSFFVPFSLQSGFVFRIPGPPA